MRVSVGINHQKRVIFTARIYDDLPRYQNGTYITKLYVLFHLRHQKARLLLSIKKIGWFEGMGIKKVSVSFN